MNRTENIEQCVRYLMQQEGMEMAMPEGLEAKQRLLRALMNIWEPQPLSSDYLSAQDAELQAQLADKGEVRLPKGEDMVLWRGDITRLSRGLGCWHPLHGCIDNAIHSAAGLQLRQACNEVLRGGEIATGEAIITEAYNLPARYVLHTVGPIVATGVPTPEQEEQLAECYRSCLRLASERGCRSVAFCCISTGEFRFPNQRAAEVALAAVSGADWGSVEQVIFNVFKEIDYDIYGELLGAR